MIAAHARLAGFEVGTNRVMGRLGLRPVAQLEAWTWTPESPAGTMSAVTARIRIVLDTVLKSYDIANKEGRMAYIRFASIHIIQKLWLKA